MSLSDKEIKAQITKNWDESAVDYDSHVGHGIQTKAERDAWKEAFSSVLSGNGLRILDVGCGTGEIGLMLAEMGHEVTGLDLSEKMLEKARAKAAAMGLEVIYRQGDAEIPPFEEGTFDAIVTRHVLWTLPHPEEALQAWRNVLKSGGKAIAIEGVWDDGSPGKKILRAVNDLCIIVLDGKDPRKGWYGKELNDSLPNHKGLTAEKCGNYLLNAGFRSADILKINEVRDIQRKRMSLMRKMFNGGEYYLIYGVK